MSKTAGTTRSESKQTTAADLLVEQVAKNGEHDGRSAPRSENPGAGWEEDRSVAKIHTGARAVHAPAPLPAAANDNGVGTTASHADELSHAHALAATARALPAAGSPVGFGSGPAAHAASATQPVALAAGSGPLHETALHASPNATGQSHPASSSASETAPRAPQATSATEPRSHANAPSETGVGASQQIRAEPVSSTVPPAAGGTSAGVTEPTPTASDSIGQAPASSPSTEASVPSAGAGIQPSPAQPEGGELAIDVTPVNAPGTQVSVETPSTDVVAIAQPAIGADSQLVTTGGVDSAATGLSDQTLATPEATPSESAPADGGPVSDAAVDSSLVQALPSGSSEPTDADPVPAPNSAASAAPADAAAASTPHGDDTATNDPAELPIATPELVTGPSAASPVEQADTGTIALPPADLPAAETVIEAPAIGVSTVDIPAALVSIAVTTHDSISSIDVSASVNLPVSIIEVAEPTIDLPTVDTPAVLAPTLSVGVATGIEDTAIPLNIAAGLPVFSDTINLSVTITGLPAGAALSVGTQQQDGSWLLSGDQLVGLTLTPAPDSSADFDLTITATTHDSITGTDASVSATLPVVVAAVPGIETPSLSAPTLSVGAATGIEDTAIPLDIAAGLPVSSDTASLTVTVTGLPEDATLSAGAQQSDGSWLLSCDQLVGLTLTPAPDSSADFDLTITATTHDSITGTDDSVSATLPVVVAEAPAIDVPALTTPAVLAPTLSLGVATGIEDTAIPLNIAAGLPISSDTTSLSVTIAGLPEGATLSAGAQQQDGSWLLSGDQLVGLTLTPPADYSGSFDLAIAATTHDSITGAEASTSAILPVNFMEVAEPAVGVPSLSAATLSVGAAVGAEDAVIPLDIAVDLPISSDTADLSVTVTVTGLPEGATLSAGAQQQDGSWLLSGDQLVGLTLTPPADYSGSFDLAIAATTHDSITGAEASTSAILPVNFMEVAEPAVGVPSLSAATLSVGAAVGAEDAVIPLNIAVDLPISSDTADLSVTVTVTGLPEGATLSAGAQQPDGSWLLAGDQLVGLSLTPAPDSSADFDLTITATTHDSITGTDASVSATLPVVVVEAPAIDVPGIDLPVVLAPTLSVGFATGTEDTAIPLNIAAGLPVSGDTASLSVTITGLPEGATLSAGVQQPDGSWMLSGDQLVGLTLTPPADYSGNFDLVIAATTHDSIVGTDASVSSTLPVVVAEAPAIDVPTVDIIPAILTPTLSVGAATGIEDTSIPLNIAAGLPISSDATSLSVTITGLPEGATLSAGAQQLDGSWLLSGDQLAGLTLTPAPDSSADFDLLITAVSRDSITGTDATVSATLPVVVAEAPAIDVPTLDLPAVLAPTLSVGAATGIEDTAIPLNIAAGLPVPSDTVSLSVTITGLPEGAALSAGAHQPNGSWLLSGDQLVGLTLTPGPDSSADFDLTVIATTHDSITGTDASASAALPVVVIEAPAIDVPSTDIPVVLAPTLSVGAIAGIENPAISLSIAADLPISSDTVSLSVTSTGLSEGTTLSAGAQQQDGSWLPSDDQPVGLTPAPDSGTDFNSTVTATTNDSITGTDASVSATLPVNVIEVDASAIEGSFAITPILSTSTDGGSPTGTAAVLDSNTTADLGASADPASRSTAADELACMPLLDSSASATSLDAPETDTASTVATVVDVSPAPLDASSTTAATSDTASSTAPEPVGDSLATEAAMTDAEFMIALDQLSSTAPALSDPLASTLDPVAISYISTDSATTIDVSTDVWAAADIHSGTTAAATEEGLTSDLPYVPPPASIVPTISFLPPPPL